MMSIRPSTYVLLISLFLVTGCMSAYQSPVDDIDDPRFLDSGRIHRVNTGETLYAVAWIYDLDFMHIARVNNLSSPYTIIPGQILNVDPRAEPAVNVQTPTSIRTTAVQRPATNQGNPSSRQATTARPEAVRPVRAQQGPVSWGWPAQGPVIGNFSSAEAENKGIDIAGRKGDPVLAAADGEVVYAGSGLLRYGDLVIIKHNDQFLSAYAHNNALLVAEGDNVRRGQQIAELGSTGIDQDMLHFEIRQEGQPVDPIRFLPPKS